MFELFIADQFLDPVARATALDEVRAATGATAALPVSTDVAPVPVAAWGSPAAIAAGSSARLHPAINRTAAARAIIFLCTLVASWPEVTGPNGTVGNPLSSLWTQLMPT